MPYRKPQKYSQQTETFAMRGERAFRDDSGSGNRTRARKSRDGKMKGPVSFAGLVASFWPLAVVPPILVTLCLRHGIAGEQAAGGRLPVLAGIASAFLINSLFTIWFYKEDKQLAERNLRRIPEFHLHFWEVLCGWPGALYAQRRYHHKWKKRSYLIIFWLYVALNLLGMWYLICPEAMKAAAADAFDQVRRLAGG